MFHFFLNYLGQCIEINNKCNGVVDCDDGTDELECEFLILDKNYSKNKLPLPNAQALKDESVKVYFSITMTSYPRIDASNSRITTDYDLNLKWYDPRLIFRNLKPDETFNDLAAGMYWQSIQPKNLVEFFSCVLQNIPTSILF